MLIGEVFAGSRCATTSMASSLRSSRVERLVVRVDDPVRCALVEHLLQRGVGDLGDELEQRRQRLPRRRDERSVRIGRREADDDQRDPRGEVVLLGDGRSGRGIQRDDHVGFQNSGEPVTCDDRRTRRPGMIMGVSLRLLYLIFDRLLSWLVPLGREAVGFQNVAHAADQR